MAKKINLTEQEGKDALQAIIDQRIEKLLEAESLGYPQDIKMNANDGVGTSGKTGKAGSDDATNVKMNANDKNLGNVDSAAVEVKASGTMGKSDVHAGQPKPTLKTKESGPDKQASQPFTEKANVDMEAMDKEGDDTTAVSVSAGGETSSKQETNVGMKKSEFKEKAENEKEKEKRIADAIEMKEGMQFKNKKALLDFINEQAKKVSELL